MRKRFSSDLQEVLKTSPWIILGATAILLVIVFVMATENTQRKKRYISDMLSVKGAALIRAVEAGARTGMMGWQLGGQHIQRLLEETTRLPDVLYMALVDENGVVLAHSDSTRVGSVFRRDNKLIHIGPDQKEDWKLVVLEDGKRVFEVHRHFQPMAFGKGRFGGRSGMGHHHGRWFDSDKDQGADDDKGWFSSKGIKRWLRPKGMDDEKDWFDPEKVDNILIVVGLDVAPFQETIKAEIRTTIILSVVLILLGFSGLVSLFWMNHYRITKKSLRDTSAFADEVVTHLPVGLIATDHKSLIAFFNAAAEKITGKQRKAVLGQPVEAVIPEELCGFQKKIENGKSVLESELECVFSHGRRVPISFSATGIVNEVGDFVGNIFILRDLGEMRRLQEEVRRQEKLAAVGGLAAGVAHEIRNPLSSIKGMATYFAGLFEDNSEPKRAAGVMIQEVDRLNRVITELLEFARPTNLNIKKTDIKSLLTRSLQLIKQDAEARKVVLELKTVENLCDVNIDPDRISQCLLNLYLNSIQAMDNGGKLVVTANHNGDQQMNIEVSDSGSGIASEDLAKIFNPYYTTKSTGTGLGLAIVHKIINAHKGHIKVASVPGKGTTVTFSIPCQHKS